MDVQTERDIDYPAADVWDVLADFAAYEQWNPYVTIVSGELREGAVIEIEITPSTGNDRTVTVKITDLDPGSSIEWVGTAFYPWLFETRQSITLEPIDDNCTRVSTTKQLTGILARFVASDHIDADLDAMHRALEAEVNCRSNTDRANR